MLGALHVGIVRINACANRPDKRKQEKSIQVWAAHGTNANTTLRGGKCTKGAAKAARNPFKRPARSAGRRSRRLNQSARRTIIRRMALLVNEEDANPPEHVEI